MSMSEHMETLGMRALSLDNAGDNGEKDLGVPKDADNNDDEEPGQICMYACVLFIIRWQCRVLEAVPSMQEPFLVPPMQVLPLQTPEGS